MGKILWRTVAGRSVESIRMESWRRLFHAVPVVFVAWMCLGGAACAGKRTYEVSSVRMKAKATTSVWPPYANGTARHVERLETVDGRWALETSGLEDEKAESAVYGKMLDSTGRVIWEDTIGDVNYLSATHPAFLTTSPLGAYSRLYNFEVGTEPLLTFPSGLDDIVWSPDGAAFALSGAGFVRIATITGKMLGSFALPDRERDNLCSAVSESGRYFAIGEAKMEAPSHPGLETRESDQSERQIDSTSDPHLRKPRRAQGDRAGVDERKAATPPSRVRPIITHNGVAAYDCTGHLMGQFRMPGEWEFPRCLTISGVDPPRVAVATDKRIAAWTGDGLMIWQDSLNAGALVLCLTSDDRLLALGLGNPYPLTFRAWDGTGKLATQLALPVSLTEGSKLVEFHMFGNDSVEVRTDLGAAVVRWTDEKD